MLLLRILAVLTVLFISASVVAWIGTRNTRYLQLAWRIAKGALMLALLMMSLLAAERLIAI